jgi:hypothetical protein
VQEVGRQSQSRRVSASETGFRSQREWIESCRADLKRPAFEMDDKGGVARESTTGRLCFAGLEEYFGSVNGLRVAREPSAAPCGECVARAASPCDGCPDLHTVFGQHGLEALATRKGGHFAACCRHSKPTLMRVRE